MSAEEVTCEEFVELVTDYFEGALPRRTLGHVEEHLVMCDWCVAYVGQMQATIVSLGALRESQPAAAPESLLAALRERRASGA
jgi:predicted anti-sigma-YlaC factor YlaD